MSSDKLQMGVDHFEIQMNNGGKDGSQLTKNVMVSSLASCDKEEGRSIKDEFDGDRDDDKAGINVLFKLRPYETPIFTLVYGMVKENEIPFYLALVIMVLEDLQLFSASWRYELINTNVLRWIFNPILAFVETSTFVAHIISWIILVVLIVCIGYCGHSLATGQIRFMSPLYLLRFLTIVVSTVLYIPILETFILPTSCVKSSPLGYPTIDCSSGFYTGILVTAIIGSVVVTIFGLLMSLLYFDSAVNSKGGKRNGRVDVFYTLVRVVLVVLDRKVDTDIFTIVNTVLLFLLLAFFVYEQPFYHGVLNNLRAGLFTGAFVLSICSLSFVQLSSFNPNDLIISGIICSAGAVVLGYFGNMYHVDLQVKYIFQRLREYDASEGKTHQPLRTSLLEIRKSYLNLIYDKTDEVRKRHAVSQKVNVFPAPHWVEIAARFIQNSYLDKESVTLANRLLEVGTLQFKTSSTVYLSYLSYIHTFFPFLADKGHAHMTTMLRKCRLALDQRFLVYLHQQSIRQVDSANAIMGDDGNLQYTSYVEYQSLENAARKNHVDTLIQIRDFWQAVRSDANDNALSACLTRVSSLASQTEALYKRLLNRFPNSRNVYILYARYHSTVTADLEQTTAYKNMAENLDSVHNEDNFVLNSINDRSEKDSHSEADRKSATNSRASTEASKESRLIRQKRNLLTNRLELPMIEFVQRGNLISILFLSLLIAATAYSKYSVDHTSTAIDRLDLALTGRRYLHFIFSNTRRMTYAAENNDTATFNKYFAELATEQRGWQRSVQPFYRQFMLDEERVPIFIWNSKLSTFDMGSYNIYDCSEALVTSVAYVLGFNSSNNTALMSLYSNHTFTSTNVAFRYIFDNLNVFHSLLSHNCMEVAVEAANQVSVQYIVVGVLYFSLLLLVLVGGIFLPYRIMSGCLKTQDDILGLFRKIPRNLVLKFITDLEEEIEVIGGEGENGHLATKGTTDTGKRETTVRWTLKWQYILVCLGLLASIVVMFYMVYQHLNLTQFIPIINNHSRHRVSTSQRVYTLAVETVIADRDTWKQGTALAHLKDAITTLKNLQEKVTRGLEPLLKDTSTYLYQGLRSGGCWQASPAVCQKQAIPSIGFDLSLVTSGVDTQVLRVITEAEKWINEGDFTSITNNRLLLLEQLAHNLKYIVSTVVQNGLLSIVNGSISQTTIAIFLLMGVIFLLAVAAYVEGFFRTARTFHANNRQLIALLYFVPQADRIKIQDLNTFIDSGGAILN